MNFTSVKILDPILGEIDPRVVFYDSKWNYTTPPACVDVYPSAPVVSAEGDSASFTYTIAESDLPAPTAVDVYWADANGQVIDRAGSVTTATGKGTHEASVPLGVAPSGTTHLLVRADPNGGLVEINEQNNDTSLRVTSDPTLTVRVAPSNLEKNRAYTVSVDVKSNSRVIQNFSIRLAETPYATGIARVDANFQPFVSASQDIIVSPGETGTRALGLFEKRWDWIPRDNPVVTVSDVIDEIFSASIGNALDKVPGLLGRFLQKVNLLLDIADTYDFIYKESINIPVRSVTFDYRIHVAGFENATASRTVDIDVPIQFRIIHTAFISELLLAKAYLGSGYTLFQVNPLVGAALLSMAASKFRAAKEFYTQAFDPPDTNFTELAIAETPRIAAVDALPNGPIKRLALTTLELQGLKHAEAVSRDRALGARAADDALWESRQLLATTEFSSKAALLEGQFVQLESLVRLSLALMPAYTGEDLHRFLVENGLPEPLVESLEALGWSPTQIDVLRSNLLRVAPEGLAPPESAVSSRLATLTSAAIAIEELADAISVRVERLGEEVRVPTEEERAALDASRAEIVDGLTFGIPSVELREAIGGFIDHTRRLVLETNNFAWFEADLDYAYSALISFQQLDSTPAGVGRSLDRLQADGLIDVETADPLRVLLAQSQRQLVAGDYTAATGTMARFEDEVRAGLSGELADHLTAYASYITGLLEANEVIVHPPLTVERTIVNGGLAQRSNIESITVSFSQGTNIQALIDSGEIIDAIQVSALGGSVVDLNVGHYRWDSASNTLFIDLTVDGFGGSGRTLLADGNYQLRLRISDIRNADAIDQVLQDADDDGDGFQTYGFHRLFGDADGDGDMDNSDAFAFKSALNKSTGQDGFVPWFDFDGDGVIDLLDFAEMKKRYGKRILL